MSTSHRSRRRPQVHASQSIEILKPLPAVSGSGWKLKKRITGVTENKTGLLVDEETILVDGHGTPYAKLYVRGMTTLTRSWLILRSPLLSTSVHVRLGAISPSALQAPRKRSPSRRTRSPTGSSATRPRPSKRSYTGSAATTTCCTSVRYLLLPEPARPPTSSADPSIGQASGFGGVILHGLATYGFAARALVSAIGGHDPKSLQFFAVRFTSPVKPGEALETSVWEIGPGPNGTTEVTFITKNLNTGKASDVSTSLVGTLR